MPESKKKQLLKRKLFRERKRKRFLNRPSSNYSPSLQLKQQCIDDPNSLDFTGSSELFRSLLCPAVDETVFFTEYWETKPLIINRQNVGTSLQCGVRDYSSLFSFGDLQDLVSSGCVQYGRNVNVCRYVAGKREGLNGNGVVSLGELDLLWSEKKATFQFHQPQQFKDVLWRLLSLLETYFSCLVGSNVYITPSGSQGLAPHYDDVEVFILQLEGRKHWRLYPPLVALPETCSDDLTMEDIGEPSHDLILEAGDVMYFPRGTIHHADTPTDVSHSTHLTISTYQNHSAGNLLRQFLPGILEKLIREEPVLREGLPLNYLSLPGGYGNQGQQATPSEKSAFMQTVQELTLLLTKGFSRVMNIVKEQYSIDFIHSRLPPYHIDVAELEPRGAYANYMYIY